MSPAFESDSEICESACNPYYLRIQMLYTLQHYLDYQVARERKVDEPYTAEHSQHDSVFKLLASECRNYRIFVDHSPMVIDLTRYEDPGNRDELSPVAAPSQIIAEALLQHLLNKYSRHIICNQQQDLHYKVNIIESLSKVADAFKSREEDCRACVHRVIGEEYSLVELQHYLWRDFDEYLSRKRIGTQSWNVENNEMNTSNEGVGTYWNIVHVQAEVIRQLRSRIEYLDKSSGSSSSESNLEKHEPHLLNYSTDKFVDKCTRTELRESRFKHWRNALRYTTMRENIVATRINNAEASEETPSFRNEYAESDIASIKSKPRQPLCNSIGSPVNLIDRSSMGYVARQVQETERHIQSLNTQLMAMNSNEALKISNMDLDRLQSKCCRLAEELNICNHPNLSDVTCFATIQSTLDLTTQKFDKLTREKQSLDLEKMLWRKHQQYQKSEVHHLQRELMNMKSHTRQNLLLQKQFDDGQHTINRLRAQLDEANSHADQSQKEMDELKFALQAARHDLTSSQIQICNLERRVADVSSTHYRKCCDDAKQECTILEKRVRNLENHFESVHASKIKIEETCQAQEQSLRHLQQKCKILDTENWKLNLAVQESRSALRARPTYEACNVILSQFSDGATMVMKDLLSRVCTSVDRYVGKLMSVKLSITIFAEKEIAKNQQKSNWKRIQVRVPVVRKSCSNGVAMPKLSLQLSSEVKWLKITMRWKLLVAELSLVQGRREQLHIMLIRIGREYKLQQITKRLRRKNEALIRLICKCAEWHLRYKRIQQNISAVLDRLHSSNRQCVKVKLFYRWWHVFYLQRLHCKYERSIILEATMVEFEQKLLSVLRALEIAANSTQNGICEVVQIDKSSLSDLRQSTFCLDSFFRVADLLIARSFEVAHILEHRSKECVKYERLHSTAQKEIKTLRDLRTVNERYIQKMESSNLYKQNLLEKAYSKVHYAAKELLIEPTSCKQSLIVHFRVAIHALRDVIEMEFLGRSCQLIRDKTCLCGCCSRRYDAMIPHLIQQEKVSKKQRKVLRVAHLQYTARNIKTLEEAVQALQLAQDVHRSMQQTVELYENQAIVPVNMSGVL